MARRARPSSVVAESWIIAGVRFSDRSRTASVESYCSRISAHSESVGWTPLESASCSAITRSAYDRDLVIARQRSEVGGVAAARRQVIDARGERVADLRERRAPDDVKS